MLALSRIACTQWNTSGINIYKTVTRGNVSIGTISPAYPLDRCSNRCSNERCCGNGYSLKTNRVCSETKFHLDAASASRKEYGFHSIGNG